MIELCCEYSSVLCISLYVQIDWSVLGALIYTVHLSVCHYHVTHEFQSESTLYSLAEYQVTPCSKQAPYLWFT